MSAIDLDGFRSTPLCHDPYDYLIVPGFLKTGAIGAIDADYPHIAKAGSFPVSELDFGPAFAALVDELQDPGVAEAFADKFAVALDGCPTTITVRGRCSARDGRIHTDTESKIVTVLIYMNAAWEEDGGRLRVLRSGDDLDDFTAEVPPIAGTLLAFRRSATSFHGHPPFVGERRVVQLNWVTDEDVVRREHRRHRFTARLKKIFPFG